MGLVYNQQKAKAKAPEGKTRKSPTIELPSLSRSERTKYRDLNDEVPTPNKSRNPSYNSDSDEESPPTKPKSTDKTVRFDEPVNKTRPFDDVVPIERPPLPREQAVERGTSHLKDNSTAQPKPDVKRGTVIKPKESKGNTGELKSVSLEESLLGRYLETGAHIPLGELLQVAPAVRRLLARKCRFRNVQKKTITSFYSEIPPSQAFTWSTEILEDLNSSDYIVNAAELSSPEDTFETFFDVLDKEIDGMPIGTIVHRDIIDSYINEVDSEGKRIILVAAPSEALRCVFPKLNGHPDLIEGILDMGSMILCIDKKEAIGRGIEWDPSTVIHMQSANGNLNRTLGLARNVLMELGDLQFRAQLHVIEKAPYQLLIGRPFESLTCMVTEAHRDGHVDITLTCPNTGHKIQMGTYPRGMGIQVEREDKASLVPSERPAPDKDSEPSKSSPDTANFQETSMNC